jgi:Mrp family chromosome partitioning ATPase
LGQEQNFFNTLSSAKKSSYVTSLTLFEPAITPATPLPSKRPLTIGVAGLAGLLLSLVAVFILERFDRRWWRARDLEMRFKIADLGQIPVGPALRMIGQTFIGARLRAVQEVQTNIFLSGASDAQTLMITSPASNEARAAFTVDLADLLAHAGHKVLLVDADFTGAPLTRLLQAQGASQRWTHLLGQARSDVWMDLKPTALPNVTLLPGNLDSTTPALVPSLRWRELIESVHGVADFIIFDGPAALHGPDAALLAPHVGGIVLAIDPNKDSPEQIATSIKRLQHHEGSRLLGAVTFVPSKPQSRIISFWRQFHGQKPPEQLARDAAAGQSTVDAAHLIAKGQLSEPVAAGGGAGARPTEPDIPIADAYDSKEAASIPGSTATRSEPIGVPQEVARRPKPYAHRTLRSNRRAPK